MNLNLFEFENVLDQRQSISLVVYNQDIYHWLLRCKNSYVGE